MTKIYKFESRVSVFNMEDGWHFVAVPVGVTKNKYLLKRLQDLKNQTGAGWKFLPIVAKVGKTEWRTALLPLGKHSVEKDQKFIAIKKEVRKKEGLQYGDKINISFKLI